MHREHAHTHGHSAGERLYIHRHSLVHELPGHIKLLAFFSFIIIAVLTPIQQWPSFVGYFLIIFLTIAISKLPPWTLAKRATIEFPFIIFALLMPFTAGGESFDFGLISLSREGSIAGINLLTKATLGVLCSMILAGSTTAHSLLAGFVRIKTPSLFVQIAAFMIRYLNVINEQMSRMKVARESRGFQATGIRSWPIFTSTLGALFIRSYERGERVHLAMLSRGYAGTLSSLATEQVRAQHWRLGLTFPLLAFAAFLIGRVLA
ncbi:MAG: cobalt ECF transporter T component CbiQ [Actinobacteria bacterium]|nr:cobalt ECF transporter T component CbiQ [Actinomycetota bacterium]